MLPWYHTVNVGVSMASKKQNTDIKFKLSDIMEKKNISKNKLCRLTDLRFETIQGYYKGNISRIDLYVIAKLCKVLDCNVQDIVEYKPNNEHKI